MSETKFTPGPWIKGYGVFIQDPTGRAICELVSNNWEADKNIIAAAPELYWVLHQVSTDIESQGVLIEWHQAILDVLAKARGEP